MAGARLSPCCDRQHPGAPEGIGTVKHGSRDSKNHRDLHLSSKGLVSSIHARRRWPGSDLTHRLCRERGPAADGPTAQARGQPGVGAGWEAGNFSWPRRGWRFPDRTPARAGISGRPFLGPSGCSHPAQLRRWQLPAPLRAVGARRSRLPAHGSAQGRTSQCRGSTRGCTGWGLQAVGLCCPTGLPGQSLEGPVQGWDPSSPGPPGGFPGQEGVEAVPAHGVWHRHRMASHLSLGLPGAVGGARGTVPLGWPSAGPQPSGVGAPPRARDYRGGWVRGCHGHIPTRGERLGAGRGGLGLPGRVGREGSGGAGTRHVPGLLRVPGHGGGGSASTWPGRAISGRPASPLPPRAHWLSLPPPARPLAPAPSTNKGRRPRGARRAALIGKTSARWAGRRGRNERGRAPPSEPRQIPYKGRGGAGCVHSCA